MIDGITSGIKKDEGFRSKPYDDSVEISTPPNVIMIYSVNGKRNLGRSSRIPALSSEQSRSRALIISVLCSKGLALWDRTNCFLERTHSKRLGQISKWAIKSRLCRASERGQNICLSGSSTGAFSIHRSGARTNPGLPRRWKSVEKRIKQSSLGHGQKQSSRQYSTRNELPPSDAFWRNSPQCLPHKQTNQSNPSNTNCTWHQSQPGSRIWSERNIDRSYPCRKAAA